MYLKIILNIKMNSAWPKNIIEYQWSRFFKLAYLIRIVSVNTQYPTSGLSVKQIDKALK